MTNRREHDLLGDRDVPAEALYGVQTLRAMENFAISGVELSEFPTLITALASVKEATAETNRDLGLLSAPVAQAIIDACREIRNGEHHSHFRVDMIQGGAGTSTNMNANEVIANRALELMGHERGKYDIISPNSHVNLSQSTNDVYPTAIKLAMHSSIDDLKEAMGALAGAFLLKGEEFSTSHQDGSHAAPGRGADDTRPGVHCVRAHDARGCRSSHGGAGADSRDQHGRDGDRDGHHAQRVVMPRVCGSICRGSPDSS